MFGLSEIMRPAEDLEIACLPRAAARFGEDVVDLKIMSGPTPFAIRGDKFTAVCCPFQGGGAYLRRDISLAAFNGPGIMQLVRAISLCLP